jgi:hypothetical protein
MVGKLFSPRAPKKATAVVVPIDVEPETESDYKTDSGGGGSDDETLPLHTAVVPSSLPARDVAVTIRDLDHDNGREGGDAVPVPRSRQPSSEAAPAVTATAPRADSGSPRVSDDAVRAAVAASVGAASDDDDGPMTPAPRPTTVTRAVHVSPTRASGLPASQRRPKVNTAVARTLSPSALRATRVYTTKLEEAKAAQPPPET